MSDSIIKVNMADIKICRPPDMLKTLGLGSCVGVVIYDKRSHISGMAHIMLPDSKYINDKENIVTETNRAKFADTAIADMVEMLIKEGAKKHNLVAKIAGGAHMYMYGTYDNQIMHVGERNIEAVEYCLKKLNIKILAKDVGGNYGRTIIFDPEKCILHIRSAQKKNIEI
ncbi:chemotaxis protein CheD [Lachnospiraceae bacterium RM5]|nr:chemotaxis protein CheD [Lachnospiraceae bacterium RM5]